MRIYGLLLLGLVISMAGCATPPVQRVAVFDEAEYVSYGGIGTAVIRGQAFAKTKGGEVRYAAGNVISLTPVTTYSTEYFTVRVIQQKPISPADPRTEAYRRQTRADASGNFAFTGVPAGDYYVTTPIFWQYATHGAYADTGAVVGAKVHVDEGQTIRVIVTR